MQIIDAHVHFSQIASFAETARTISQLEYSGRGLQNEWAGNRVVLGIGMGVTEASEGFPDRTVRNPMGLDLEREIPAGLVSVAGINPVRLAVSADERQRELIAIERELQNPRTVGLKIYAGYYPYYVYDEVYEPVYQLAAQYQLPVVLHSGDTYSPRGLLKYSHPLHVDELAVSHRDVNFVIAHFGDPWIMETAEVINKNPNVFADLSGLIVGTRNDVERFRAEPLFVQHIQRGLIYADQYEKILFGSDWPLVQLAPYIEFVQSLIPPAYQEHVFYRNALRVFPRIAGYLSAAPG